MRVRVRRTRAQKGIKGQISPVGGCSVGGCSMQENAGHCGKGLRYSGGSVELWLGHKGGREEANGNRGEAR